MPVLKMWGRSRLLLPPLIAMLALLMSVRAEAFSRPIQELTTPAGIRLWLAEEHSIPLVAIRFAFGGGALQDPDGSDGLTATMTALLSEGAGDLDASAFARALADAGAKLDFSATRDQVYGGLDVLPKHLERASKLLRTALETPRFDTAAITRVKTQRVAELEIEAGNPRSVAFNRWYRDAFPGHPYGRPANGRIETVEALTQAAIKAQHRRLIARSAMRVVIVGDIGAEAAARVVDRIFGNLPTEAKNPPPVPVKVAYVTGTTLVDSEQPLATAAFGGPGVPPTDPDYPAMLVLRQIVGSGDFNSVLMEEIRVKRGLAYAVSLNSINDTVASVLLGGMATKTENMRPALAVLRDVLARLIETGPTRDQLENAKQYLTGSYLLDFDTNAKLAASLLRLWIQGRQPDHIAKRNATINAVTIDDVRRVATRLLNPGRLNFTIVGRLPKK